MASLTSGREKEKRTKKEKEWEFVCNAQSIVMVIPGGGGGGGRPQQSDLRGCVKVEMVVLGSRP